MCGAATAKEEEEANSLDHCSEPVNKQAGKGKAGPKRGPLGARIDRVEEVRQQQQQLKKKNEKKKSDQWPA